MDRDHQHIIPRPLNDGDWDEADRKLREEIEAKYAEAIRSAGFFRRIYLRFKMRREIGEREARLLRMIPYQALAARYRRTQRLAGGEF
jgi:hypothetical protein